MRPDLGSFLPAGKHDTAKAEALVALGYPAVEPILPSLLEWVQDLNWPVARVLCPFVASIGTPLAPHILQNYAETLPIAIAEKCGPAEIVDLIVLLNECSAEREAMEDSWDGDTLDDIWRTQLRLASLFPGLIATYALEIAQGLQSPHATTRFWIADGFERTPDRRVLLALKHALSKETDELNKETLKNAVNACSPRRWLSFLR